MRIPSYTVLMSIIHKVHQKHTQFVTFEGRNVQIIRGKSRKTNTVPNSTCRIAACLQLQISSIAYR